MRSSQPELSNKEKTPIHQALRTCIADLERIVIDHAGKSYKDLVNIINEVFSFNDRSHEEEKTQAYFDRSEIETLLIKPKQLLYILFNPDFQSFEKLGLINNPLYTDKGHQITEDEFNKKIPIIKQFIIERIEKIVDQNKNLSGLKLDLQFLNPKSNNNSPMTNY
ncbi:MAG TPA: hypothetical protein VHA13_04445 [Gammaproteobacteria bacterium]|nr:hypothetical protein [Gammaproteobacteria bacterium]